MHSMYEQENNNGGEGEQYDEQGNNPWLVDVSSPVNDQHDFNNNYTFSSKEDYISDTTGSPMEDTVAVAEEAYEEELVPSIPQVKIPRRSAWYIFIFSIFQIGICTGQAFSQAIYLPLQVIEYTGEEQKEQVLAIVGLIVAMCGMLTGPISGYISDRVNTRMGRRTPFILVGSIVYAVSFIIRPILPCRITFFFILNTMVTVVGNMGLVAVITAYLAMIPESFPTEQMGLVSGLNGFTNLISIGIAVALFGYIYPYIGAFPICMTIAGMILVNMVIQIVFVKDPILYNRSISTNNSSVSSTGRTSQISIGRRIYHLFISFLTPFKNLDFLWTFLTRFMFTLGTSMIQAFGLYFLKDKVGPVYTLIVWSDVLKSAEQALAAFMVVILLAGLCSSITGGVMSDRIGRKPVIMISGLLVSIGCVAMCFITNFNMILLFSIFVGLGSGSYYGTDL